MHEDVGRVLEELYGEQRIEIAPVLARHFQEAGKVDKSIDYLHQAGQRAVQMVANQEGISYLKRAIDMLKTQPECPQRDQQEMALRLALNAPLVSTLGFGDLDVRSNVKRALDLAESLGEGPPQLTVLWIAASFYGCNGQIYRAVGLSERMLLLAERP